MKKAADIEPRNAPVQGRSKKRAKQIIDVTGELLERVGFDDLNTILIAKEVGISIGSLYHYFPNKQAIMHAMGKQWLAEIEQVLQQYDSWDIENMSLEESVKKMLQANLKVYKRQKALLTLVQAMFSVPELRELDEQHDEMVISNIANVFKRMGMKKQLKERERIARVYLEATHALFLTINLQQGERSKRTLADLNYMIVSLLRSHLET